MLFLVEHCYFCCVTGSKMVDSILEIGFERSACVGEVSCQATNPVLSLLFLIVKFEVLADQSVVEYLPKFTYLDHFQVSSKFDFVESGTSSDLSNLAAIAVSSIRNVNRRTAIRFVVVDSVVRESRFYSINY